MVTRSFAVAQPAGLYRLRIDNGGTAGQFGRVSSAMVSLNGTVVVAANAFNQTVQVIEREVPLSAQNELRVMLQSAPGSGFTLTIFNERSPLQVRITAPEAGFVTPEDIADVSGTLMGDAASLLVNGVQAQVSGTSFTARVRLAEGTNRIVAIATGAAGETDVDSVLVRRDTDPPLVVIETPRDGERLITESVTIAGTVNDIIPGATINSDDVTVTVNDLPATVNNRTFTFPDLALALGENTVTAVAVDRAGNTRSTEISVTREPDLAGIRITIQSGNNQQAPIHSSLAQPLVVTVRTEGGAPIASRPVEFEVSKGDGLLGNPAANLRRVMLLTDAAGTASVPFTLGSRTGEGFHRVRVTTPGSLTFAEFCATAQSTAPTTMSITLRPPVRSAAGERMADPLAVIVTDAGGNPVVGVPVTFQVELGGGSFDGQESVAATTNPDGVAQAFWTLGPDAGVANNRASASFEGNPGFPATFVVSGLRADPAGETTVSGTVQNSNGGPIVGARIEIRGTGLSTFTGSDGRFTISGVPPGEQRVAIMGSAANDPARGIFFPHIDFALQIVQGAKNALDQIVVLPFLDMGGSKVVGGDEDVILGMEGVPGFGIKVFAHSAILPDGTRGTIRMSSSQVKFDKVPMPPPRGSTAFIVGTLQPGGIRFDPPAQVIYPNVEGLAPGDVADIYAFHHDIGQFVNVGPGTVSEDASVVVSDPGFGIVESGWHCLIRIPGPTANCANGCSAQLEWQIMEADGSFGPARTSAPVTLSCIDGDAKKARTKVTFTPGGGSFDSVSWSSNSPTLTLSEASTSGTSALVKVGATNMAGEASITSPIYRIPVPNQADKTCQAQVGVQVGGVELVNPAPPTGGQIATPAPAPDFMGNEFTYSTASPGILTIPVRIRITPNTPEVRAMFANKVRIRLDAISGSTLTWDRPFAGEPMAGNAVYNATTQLWEATAMFSGLPTQNGAFGQKTAMVDLLEGTSTLCNATREYEVFFPRDATNNPGGTAENWFYYWNQTGAGDADLIFSNDAVTRGGIGQTPAIRLWSTFAGPRNEIRISDALRTGLGFIARNDKSGIDGFANVVIHENRHVQQVVDNNTLPFYTGVTGALRNAAAAGWSFNTAPTSNFYNHFDPGPDGQPGVAGVDDDGDGTTDEADEFAVGVGGDVLLDADFDDLGTDPRPGGRDFDGGSGVEPQAAAAETSVQDAFRTVDWAAPGKQHGPDGGSTIGEVNRYDN